MPNWTDDEGRCCFDVDGVPCHQSGTGCPMHRVQPTPKSKRQAEVDDLRAQVERLTFQRDLARLNRDLEAKAFREERTSHGTTRSRVQDAISVLWHRGRIELRLDDATTKTALADALVGMFNEAERLTDERDAAFQRGVAAMREAAAHLVEHKPRHSPPAQGTGFAQFGCGYCDMAAQVRALPDPEDKP